MNVYSGRRKANRMTLEPSWCAFTYNSNLGVARTILGVFDLWSNLCMEFNRNGPSCPVRNAVHFRRVSLVGPELFAVCLDTLQVFHNYEDQWHQYQSARNIRFGRPIQLFPFLHNSANDDDHEGLSQEANDEEDPHDEPSREAEDLSSNSDLFHSQINRMIVDEVPFQMRLFSR
ncbi:unnamed protein product [Adineta steineri]|uniref:Uncharacterized protein n=1 Tax=Adineta steineri TaxID=433720 RepID=A0A818LV16_9BILA|nr:unnamed protein product [Adineta steineri]CAF1494642.1 unnamed protein product [Adineta steineri]CAF3563312.1 unnamed protein product [Adineta steineri]CAF3577950.1 unnamed protein product [Adineta steineri]